MEETKTTLQKIVEQKTDQIRIAIEQAIDNGAEIEKLGSFTSVLECCYIDRLYLQKYTHDGSIFIVLNFSSDKIANVFDESSKDDLEQLAAQKRRELEEIEKQIKEKKGKKHETDHN